MAYRDFFLLKWTDVLLFDPALGVIQIGKKGTHN